MNSLVSRRSPRRFLLAVALTCAAFILFNAALGFVIKRRHHSVYRAFLWRTEHEAPAARGLFLGHSLMAVGFDPQAFASALPASLQPAPAQFVNAALGDTTSLTHYLILRDLLPRAPQVRYLVYGFYDTQLTDVASCSWSGLIGNHALAYQFPDATAQTCAPGDPWTLWRMRVTSAIPVLADRASLWNYVVIPRRRLEAVGLPAQGENRFGRTADFAQLEEKETAGFARRVGALADENTPFAPTVLAMFRLARERSIPCGLIEMPMRPAHRARFYDTPEWAKYRQHLRQLAAATGVAYLRAEDWSDDRDFSDAIHLDERGAVKFSTRLAHELPTVLPVAGQ